MQDLKKHFKKVTHAKQQNFVVVGGLDIPVLAHQWSHSQHLKAEAKIGQRKQTEKSLRDAKSYGSGSNRAALEALRSPGLQFPMKG